MQVQVGVPGKDVQEQVEAFEHLRAAREEEEVPPCRVEILPDNWRNVEGRRVEMMNRRG